MKNLDEEAARWLNKHAHELEPEELPSEEDKMEAAQSFFSGRWPLPRSVSRMGVFAGIEDEASFNRIVGDPGTWERILRRKDLHRDWIQPQAILIFGKGWFDRVKMKASIQRLIPFPLFSEHQRQASRLTGVALEDTDAGRSKIIRIIARVEHALEMYLKGGGRSATGHIKRPGGYIIDSIRNEFIREIGADLGYRMTQAAICPRCVSVFRGPRKRKTLLRERGREFVCDQCSDASRNLELHIAKLEQEGDTKHLPAVRKEFRRALIFRELSGITCVCPSSQCPGRFVPIKSVADPMWWKSDVGRIAEKALSTMRPVKGTQRFREPPAALLPIPLSCPFCDVSFTLAEAITKQTGFKQKSGWLTGLPTMSIWKQREEQVLDRLLGRKRPGAEVTTMKDRLADVPSNPGERIAIRQRVGVLAGELLMELARMNDSTVTGVLSRCFYEGLLDWMHRYSKDASEYFFSWSSGERQLTDKEQKAQPGRSMKKSTSVVRGQEAAIHQTVLHAWIRRIAHNIPKIRKMSGSKISSISDLKWLCHTPKYRSGPRSVFTATVEPGSYVPNTSRIAPRNPALPKPRLAWIISMRREEPDGWGSDISEFISACEWQGLRISSQADVKPGDRVRVEALMMPGHPCHAPIQRVIRMRTGFFAPIVNKIREEEQHGERDPSFWRKWRKSVEAAKSAVCFEELT